ncbi:MAG: hypothetical protein Q8L88_03850 [Bacteroidota bacterium]|nr:hypothetical protein [Bacteroidota bacterium]
MNQLSQKELEQIISQYLDGELDSVETKKLEEYLSTHPSVMRDVEILRTTKQTLSRKEKLPKDDWFWLKLSNKLEQKEFHSHRIMPGARSVFAFSSLASIIFVIVGIIYFRETPIFHKFFMDRKNLVENVYRNNIMTGNILPLFSNLSKEDVLNFALFGSIGIDSANNTSLTVRNSEDKSSQIQIVRNEKLPAPPVTIHDFAKEIGITTNQQEMVDSILGSYKEKLQASVLVSENDEVAIHAELIDLNRAMVSTIASCLEPVQRTRFQKFLDVRKAPYAVVAVNAPKLEPHVIWNNIPKVSSSHNYVVISHDTVEFAEMRINVDSIREVAHRHEMRYQRLITERMVTELTERQQRAEENLVKMGQNRIRIQSSSGAFQIHFEAPGALSNEAEMVEMVKPRFRIPASPRAMVNEVTIIGDSAFSFEIPTDDQTVRVFKRLPKGEFHFEIVDSMMRGPKMKLMFKSPSNKREFESKLRQMREKDHERNLIDLDSLLHESDKQNIENIPSKTNQIKKEIEI